MKLKKNNIIHLKVKKEFGFSRFGLMANYGWIKDPKRILFSLSRYKFVAKMLSGKKDVLEIGCADGFFSKVVYQEVKKLTLIDFDKVFIDDFKSMQNKQNKIKSFVHDIVKKPMNKKFDAIYCLDVLEHIKPQMKKNFLLIYKIIKQTQYFYMWNTFIRISKYASKISKEGHVNCKTGDELRKTLKKYFYNNFIFSMNDEVLHTGYFPMSHYLFGIGCGIKKK